MTILSDAAALSRLYGKMARCRAYGTDDPDIADRRLAQDIAELREVGGHDWPSIACILEIDESAARELYGATRLTEPGDECPDSTNAA